jgi:hypothetical protein
MNDTGLISVCIMDWSGSPWWSSGSVLATGHKICVSKPSRGQQIFKDDIAQRPSGGVLVGPMS